MDGLATWSPDESIRSLRLLLWPTRLTLLQKLVRLLWLPFWLGTDLPAPNWTQNPAKAPAKTIAALRFQSLLSSTRRKQLVIRFTTLLLRAFTLALLIGCAWSIAAIYGRDSVRSTSMAITVGGLAGIGLIFAWRYRPGLRETASMVDRSFALSDRLTTAYDNLSALEGEREQSPHLAYLQVVEATNTLAMLSKHPTLKIRFPVREGVLVAGLAMVLLALHLLDGTGTSIDPVLGSSVPAFVPASDRMMQRAPIAPDNALPELYRPTVAEVQEMANLSAAAEQDLLQIADALDDNPLTSSIADAIREGDYEQAAQELDAISPSLAQMSPELKDQLASELDAAADQMTGEHPELQDSASAAADGLRSTPEQAEESLSDLSDSIQETGSQVADQTELAEQMRDAREQEETGSVQDSDGSRPDQGSDQSNGEATDTGTAGEGSDASSGQQSDDSDQSSDSGSGEQSSSSDSQESDGADAEPAGGSSADSEDSPQSSQGGGSGASGEGSESDQSSPGSSGNGSVEGDSTQPDGSSAGTSDNVETGAGTGAGGGKGDDTNRQSSNGAESRPGTGSDGSPDPNIVDGSGTGTGTASDSGDGEETTTSITLSRSPDSSGQRTGGSSTSSTGSGAGVAAGAGSTQQGDVGSAGPDSNRVPEEYRPIVEDYFSDNP